MMMHSRHLSHLHARNTTAHRNGAQGDRYAYRSQTGLSHALKPNRLRYFEQEHKKMIQISSSLCDHTLHLPSTPPAPKATLHRQLRLRDLVLTQVLCVVGSSWVGIAAGLGRAQALTWIAAMILFYLPMAVSVIYLTREMPLEGGLYVWARTAFGDLGGFMTAWNLWFYGIAVTATILYAIPTELSYMIGPSASWLPENPRASFPIVAAVALAITAAAVRGLELGKWIHNIGGISILVVYCMLIIL